jgi:hypothetical protein
MIEMAEAQLAQAGDTESAWELYQATVAERFRTLERANKYLGGLARILSIQDYPYDQDHLDQQLQDVWLDRSGEAFTQTARTTFYLREKLLIESLHLPAADPVRLPYYKAITKDFPLRKVESMDDFGKKLRRRSSRQINRPGQWAQPLVDYFSPLADTSQVRREEVGLGVNIGLLLARSAYGREEEQALVNQQVQAEVNRQYQKLESDFLPSTPGWLGRLGSPVARRFRQIRQTGDIDAEA